jgi:acyl-coenzyme A thioesterase PaaI-like protein
MSKPPPSPGFRPLASRSPFVNGAGAFFIRDNADGTRSVGTWIAEAQLNSERFAHGGFLLTFADFTLSRATNGITLNVNADFLRPARLGAWIEGLIHIRKQSPTLIFADELITCDGEELMRVSGIFKPFEKRA